MQGCRNGLYEPQYKDRIETSVLPKFEGRGIGFERRDEQTTWRDLPKVEYVTSHADVHLELTFEK